MERKYNSSTLESNTENINIELTGPAENELKDHFKEDNSHIPTDYTNLIDVANMDYHTVGKSYELKPGDDYTLATKINPNGGLKVDNDGLSLKIKAGNGIKTDDSGISIDPDNVFPKGMIVMFSGKDAPTGWAFCNGNNGTPDLRSRFVMCGETLSETGKSNSKASGSGTGKSFFKNTTSTTVSVNVTVGNTTLTEAQIPSHKHIGGMAYFSSDGMKYGHNYPGGTDIKQIRNHIDTIMATINTPRYAYTSNTGGGQGHNHPAAAASPAHNHSVDIIPPYYLLAFIMKL
ncbi:hypothetical protein [Photorhabdus sp. SF281]|uniref:hypothetical protein n=1 Tax=Photorhabdus sp. SF281 TaxID=3459527 RepID=UPI004044C63B